MTQELIKEIIEDIEKVTKEVSQSKESARDFLEKAGIYLDDKDEEETKSYCAPCITKSNT